MINELESRVRQRSVWFQMMLLGLLAALFFATPASASKHAVDFVGAPSRGSLGEEFQSANSVAINTTGAGGVPTGTFYVPDGGSFDAPDERNNRVQRFQRNDNGTPGNVSDDTYSFVSAWGAGVENGGTDFEVCTSAASCHAGAGVGGNGTLAGDGSLTKPGGIAVDQDTGDVYVADSSSRRTPDDNFRISVYSATGEFLRSFGWDVVESGPDDNGTGYEICKAGVDVCKAGLPGNGAGQIGLGRPNGEIVGSSIAVSPPDGNPATGSVFFTDSANQRINTYNFDGTSPGSIGSPAVFLPSQPESITVDSRGILYAYQAQEGEAEIQRYDSQNANGEGVGFLAPIVSSRDEVQAVTIVASAGQFKLTFGGDTTADLPFDATASEMASALEALPSIGSGGVTVAGGPGDATGSSPYKVRFTGPLGGTDVPQLKGAAGSTPLAGGMTVKTPTAGRAGPLQSSVSGLGVDLDSDGPGPDTDILYVATAHAGIQQYGPINSPGLTTPPAAVDDTHALGDPFEISGVQAEPSTGRLYAPGYSNGASGGGLGIYVLDNQGPPPTASLDSIDGVTSHSAVAHLTIDPNGSPPTRYHLEYSVDGSNWTSTPTVTVGVQEDPQEIAADIDLPGTGLSPSTTYQVRLVAGRALSAPIVTPALTFKTLAASPLAETTGSPVRTTTTARLSGRVSPQNSPASYYFEYGSAGPCDANPCTATEAHQVGSGLAFELVSQGIDGLSPNTTYHYRVVADDGTVKIFGEDMTVQTRTSDAPLQHGHLPGSPGSDRAYELISLPNSGGNPAELVQAISDDGERIVYQIHGGNPASETGNIYNQFFAQRTVAGWQTKSIYPPRDQLVASGWLSVFARNDLSSLTSLNTDNGFGQVAVYRMSPDAPANKVFETNALNYPAYGVSDNGSRVVMFQQGSPDPSHPVSPSSKFLYDVSSGTAKMVSLMPDGKVPGCSMTENSLFSFPNGIAFRAQHWISADGSLVFFPASNGCGSEPQLYVRNMETETTKLISGPTISGGSCGAALIRSTSEAVFFWTQSRLSPDDVACAEGEGDVYRYDLGDGTLDCVTCVVPGASADVSAGGRADEAIAIPENGSRVYFHSSRALLPGGGAGIYRVDVASGDLAYVGPFDRVGDVTRFGEAINADGSVLMFISASQGLNALNGQQNGGKPQYYRYDDNDGSLVCISCPQDGSPATASVDSALVTDLAETGPNLSPMSRDGQTVAFSTPTSLVDADQNTPAAGQDPLGGSDVYEWREGRLFLVSDGLTNWPVQVPPRVAGVSQSGKDIYFIAATQYTPDALDGYARVYDARIDGGFAFPPPTKPCPLEVCQGTPKGAPEERVPGTGSFSGSGAQKPTKAKKKHRHKKHHKKRAHHSKASHNRGVAR